MSVKKFSALIFLFIFYLSDISHACVGKTIYIGHLSGKNEEIIGHILSRLITERTGTSVKLKNYADVQSLLKASTGGEIDIFILDDKILFETTNQKNREEGKNIYNVKYNLVWLKPFNEKDEFIVPVIRKDTLKKFPALPKLLEKLNGLINSNQIEELKAEVEKRNIREVVKDFLKKKSLI